MNPPNKRIPAFLPVMMIFIVITMSFIVSCRIADLKLDVKEVVIPDPVRGTGRITP